ncbi:Ni/Fe-hydrogenase, b-type cytochrome subunit [Selenomonas sp. F0473]|uniref:Ni/Fe-hydrogenase, b-type cytochrome subunit n=1 Tax=Selenomonas sp. F0473 TaxID=999423 RepID=UPI00029E6FBF|nr:Ni/Fe-hydrogenase, b-type cytochrome subunit [Selenomonas sp. F0473]EKU71097.1 Ni/Fe-hydrogenase, b-type cytochrome subunit [Selenomonas sp. F0473]
MKQEERKEYYLFSPFLRIFHWLMVGAIVVLTVTGLLITKPPTMLFTEPTYSPLLMNLIRNIHFVAAFAFCAGFIGRVYGFIINRGDRLFPHFWKPIFYRQMMDVALHYMLVKPSHEPFLRNPLARSSYAGLYALVAIEVLTGFAIYNMTEPSAIGGILFGWVNRILGGEYMTHVVHHYTAWAIVLFAIGHFYMVVRAEFMEGEAEVSSMFAGSKLLRHTPADARDVE